MFVINHHKILINNIKLNNDLLLRKYKLDKQNLTQAYFDNWRTHINDLRQMFYCRELERGRESAFSLALCYIEVLGKMRLYSIKGKHSRPTIIFQKTLKEFGISKKDSQKIYRVRCEE